MGVRREGRELALMLLYREEVTGLVDPVVPGIDEADPRAVTFAESLAAGVRENRSEIDDAISAASEHWDIGRMGAVDRTILRIGVYEILHEPGTPLGVIISEAVDAARKYSSEECGKFVNGVLDHIAREPRAAERRDRE
jgi:N utilization substance protein B